MDVSILFQFLSVQIMQNMTEVEAQHKIDLQTYQQIKKRKM